MASSSRLLQLTLPLVQRHGFTRQALALSVLSLSRKHVEPLSETAVTALFGEGDEARRLLVRHWLEDARQRMRESTEGKNPAMLDLLRARLKMNEEVLSHLPEAFALLATPSSGPPLDLRPAVYYAASIADDACHLAGDDSPEVSLTWYTRRATVAAIYTAAEFHQLTSPKTAYEFLESLLSASSAWDDVNLFASYLGKNFKGILKSRGIFR